MFWRRPEPFVMGILNVTPDSFYDGGKYTLVEKAKEQALRLAEDGADVIDIGGESTRPGSEPVSLQEEIDRVCPVVEAIRKESDIPISLDTTKSGVVLEAAKLGSIQMVNDVTALRGDEKMAQTVAGLGCGVVLMHMLGTPKNMQENPAYKNIIQDLLDFFYEQVKVALKAGIKQNNIVLDPGIGFGKKVEHNLEIIKRLSELKAFGYPILMAPSRKSFIGVCLGDMKADRLWGTAAVVALSIAHGAQGVRVHDVKEMKQVLQLSVHI